MQKRLCMGDLFFEQGIGLFIINIKTMVVAVFILHLELIEKKVPRRKSDETSSKKKWLCHTHTHLRNNSPFVCLLKCQFLFGKKRDYAHFPGSFFPPKIHTMIITIFAVYNVLYIEFKFIKCLMAPRIFALKLM